jgi:hypothetical protein
MRLTSMLIISALVIMVLTSCTFVREENKSFKAQDLQPRDALGQVPIVTVEIDPDLEKQLEQEVSMMRRLEQDQQYLDEIENEKKQVKKAALLETLTNEEISSYGYSSNCTEWIDMAIDEEIEFRKNYNTAKNIWIETECGLDEFIADMEEVKKAAGRRAICAQHSGLTSLSKTLAISYLPASLVQGATSAGCIAYGGTANLKLLGAYNGAFKHLAYAIYYAKQFEKCGSR